MHMKYEMRRDRPRSVLAAALVVVVVVVLVAIVLLLALDRDDAPGPSTNPEPGAGSQTSSSVCGLADGDQTIPTVAPPAKWVVVSGTAIPESRTFGPGNRVDGVGACFARNPNGALFAVANFLGDSASPRAKAPALLDRFFDDANKTAAAAEFADRSGAAETYGLQIDGFRLVDYTRDRATVELTFRATEGPTAGSRAATSFTVAWSKGDWRIVTPPNGVFPTTAITSLTGYTTWED